MEAAKIRALTAQVMAVAPHCQGLSVGDEANRLTWAINWAEGATEAEAVAASDVIAAFDVNAPVVPEVSDLQARLVSQLAAALGLTQSQLDQLLVQASQL